MSDAPSLSRRRRNLLLALGVGIALFLALGRLGAGALIEVLWFSSLGYSEVFWRRVLSGAALRVLAIAGATWVIFLNLRAVARSMGRLHIRRRFGNLEIVEQLPPRYLFWILVGSSALLGIWFGFSVPGEAGVRILVWLNADSWGVVEPIFGKDLGFFVFALPLLSALAGYSLVLVFLLFALSVAGYMATGALGFERGRFRSDPAAFRHLALLVGAFLVGVGAQLWLSRYGLLLDGTGVEGMFGFTDHRARLPALTTLSIVAVFAGGMVGWSGYSGRRRRGLAAVLLLVLGGVGLGQLLPALVQRFQVEPNELERETQYIEWNLDATRRGFGLADLQRAPFPYDGNRPLDLEQSARIARTLPTWTPEALLSAYNSLEARFRYYSFSDVTFDRYTSENGVTPVAVAVREIESAAIENPTWQNLHLRPRFIQGAGAVVASAAGSSPEGRPTMFVESLPPERNEEAGAPSGLELTRPSVFFGSRDGPYAIVNPGPDQFLAPDGGLGTRGVDYPSGIQMSSTFLRFVMAWAFQDPNLFFSSEILDSSQLIVRRGVEERVRALAPFLTLGQQPQAVIHDGQLVWVLDGFTSTRSMPLSRPFVHGFRRMVNYIRGSVKVTVNAVTGEVRFYRLDEEDPILRAYAAVFPGMFSSIDELPSDLRSHLRYPLGLLRLQSQVLQAYHQRTAVEFHGQQDRWDTPTETGKGTNAVPYRPEFSWFPFPGNDEPEFLLSTAFVPAGRPNLTALFIARNDPGHYGELHLLEFLVQDQVPGPRLVEVLVEQDPLISQQFSLWRQGGSEVWTGHLQLIPVGDRLLYIEPVFLAAEADAVPELRRYVVSDGVRVAMEETLTEAFLALGAGSEVARVLQDLPTSSADVRARALSALDQAEASLRDGDWTGFGAALERLRNVLEEGQREPPGLP